MQLAKDHPKCKIFNNIRNKYTKERMAQGLKKLIGK